MFITDMTRQQNSEKAKQWSVTLEWKLLLPSNYNLGNSLLRQVIATTVSVSKFKRTHHKHSQHFKICISHLWSCTVVYCIINCKFVFVCNTAIGWKDPPRHRHLCCVCISLEVDLTQTKYNWQVRIRTGDHDVPQNPASWWRQRQYATNKTFLLLLPNAVTKVTNNCRRTSGLLFGVH